MKSTLLFIVCILIGACSTAKKAPSVGLSPLKKAIEGQWGWNLENCKNSPMIYSFSRDGLKMYVQSKEKLVLGDPKKTHSRITYNILDESANVIRTSIEEEDRFSAIDQKVMWDLKVLNASQFCWRRTDWHYNACTKPLQRCVGDS